MIAGLWWFFTLIMIRKSSIYHFIKIVLLLIDIFFLIIANFEKGSTKIMVKKRMFPIVLLISQNIKEFGGKPNYPVLSIIGSYKVSGLQGDRD